MPLANVQGALYVPIAAKQMRRLLDPCGGARRRDVLAAAGADVRSDEEDPSYEARVAYRKAREKGGKLITGQYSHGGWADIKWPEEEYGRT